MPEPVFEDLVKEYRGLSKELDKVADRIKETGGTVTLPSDHFAGERIRYRMEELRQQMAKITGFEITHDQLMIDLDDDGPSQPDSTKTDAGGGIKLPPPALPAWDPKLLPSPRDRRDDRSAPGSWWQRTPVRIGGAAAGVILIGGAIFGGVQLFGEGGSGSDNNTSVVAENTPADVVEVVETVLATYPPPIGSDRLQALLEEAGLVSEPGANDWYSFVQEAQRLAMWEESGFQPGFTAPQIIIKGSGVAVFDVQPGSDTSFWDRCGQRLPSGGHEICSQPDPGPLEAHRWIMGMLNLDGEYVDADPAHQYFYGFGFNADGSAGYAGTPGFDLSARRGLTMAAFIGQSPFNPQLANWTPSFVSYMNGAPAPLNADIRVIIDGDTLLFLFPGSLFPQQTFGWRAIAHGQGGPSPDPATGGADVTGGDPLAPLQQFGGEALVVGAPSPTAGETPAAPGGTSTPVGGDTAILNAEVGGGLAVFEIIYRDRNVEALLASLSPRTIEIYGEDQCRSFLATGQPDPAYNIEPITLDGPRDWLYEVDGISTNIPSTVFVDANVTLGGVTERHTLHFKLNDAGGLEWFTDCGTPVASP